MPNIEELLNDPDFLDLPESEQDSIVQRFKTNTAIEGRGKASPFTPPRGIFDPTFALRNLGALSEREEQAVAGPLRAVGQGRMKDVPSEFMAGIKGEKQTQVGDLLRDAGAPEIAAQIGGLVGSAALPTSMIGSKMLKPVDKAVTATAKASTPLVSRILNFFSGVPQKQAQEALERPEVLSKGFLKAEKEAAGKLYEKTVKPLINDPMAKVDTSNLSPKIGKELELFTPSGEKTKNLASMNSNEQSRISGWLDELKSGNLSFNRIDSIIGEIDEGLGSVYRAKELGKPAVTSSFKKVGMRLRGMLNDLRKQQHPSAAEGLDRYANVMSGEATYRTFDKYRPNITTAISALGFPYNKEIAAALASMTIPKVQALGIQAVAKGGKAALKSKGVALREFAKKENRK